MKTDKNGNRLDSIRPQSESVSSENQTSLLSEPQEILLRDPSIEPYSTSEFQAALARVVQHPSLTRIVNRFFPGDDPRSRIEKIRQIQSVEQFQKEVISPILDAIVQQSSLGLQVTGMDQLDPKKCYLYLSNHRDILCDPSFFTNALHHEGYPTPHICLGDNLLKNPLVADLIKMNQGITVRRNLSPRELLKSSKILSATLTSLITDGRSSVWLAQREGRAKTGIDETQSGVLKMLLISGQGSLLERLCALHLVPVAISYEFDPCDALKAREIYLTELQGTYQKGPEEDLISMMKGLEGFKGRIHLSLGAEMSSQILASAPIFLKLENKKKQIQWITQLIDEQIRKLFQLWPTHFIAHDLLHQSHAMNAHYTKEEKHQFMDRMEAQLKTLNFKQGTPPRVREIFLENYANALRLGALSPQAS
ncbi:MAG: 1-acyl-sn-glycerol-3-phosphate acyltransferase [Bdellovibrionia bacterium]